MHLQVTIAQKSFQLQGGKPMDYVNFLLCLVLAWIAIHLILSTYKVNTNPRKLTLPPGPSPLPIIGNLLLITETKKLHITLTELAKSHGSVMTLWLGQVPTVVISSATIAKEALQKKDSSFSTRLIMDAGRCHGHHEHSLVLLPASNARWRNLRRICNSQVFSVSRLEASQRFRRDKVKDLLSYVSSHVGNGNGSGMPVDIGQATFTVTLNLLSRTLFSMDLGDPTSEVALEFRNLVRAALKEVAKPNLADCFPLLRKIDLQGIRRRTAVHIGKLLDFFDNIINKRLQERELSDSVQSNKDVLDALLGVNQEKTEDIERSAIPHLFLDLFVAGTDTTSSTLEWAMAELLHSPEKLKKAQAELEEIIGKGNPIEEPDIVRLPYLQAVVKETFRLHPAVPFLVPRRVDSDVDVLGYTVPKSAQVFINVWAIGRDPNIWENPNSFEPERFLGSEIDVKGRDFELIPFGAGRRICPGLPLAIRMIHLTLASLIHGFDWKLEGGISPGDMDMEEMFGFTLEKAQPLRAIPLAR